MTDRQSYERESPLEARKGDQEGTGHNGTAIVVTAVFLALAVTMARSAA
ncbi:hypothetical protein AB0M80_39295 [Amycolatopsis sp. NPDC051045]